MEALEHFMIFLQKNPLHLALFGTAVITGGMLIWPLFSRLSGQSNEIGTVETVQLINRRDALVIDVRESSEYAARRHCDDGQHQPSDRQPECGHRGPPMAENAARGSSTPRSLRRWLNFGRSPVGRRVPKNRPLASRPAE